MTVRESEPFPSLTHVIVNIQSAFNSSDQTNRHSTVCEEERGWMIWGEGGRLLS